MSTSSTASTASTETLATILPAEGTGDLATTAIVRARNEIVVTDAFGVTTTPYAANDVIDTKITITDAAIANGASLGVIFAKLTVPQNLGSMSLVLHIFQKDPTGSTFTDNAALTVVEADARDNWVGSATLIATQVGASMWNYVSGQINIECRPGASSRHIYAVLETKAAVTFAADELHLQLVIDQDR
jgi:hypothetical protein